MGDLSFFRLLLGLASAKHPLVQTADASGLRLDEYGSAIEKWANSPVTITDVGRHVLEGRADAVKLNGIDRWVGGVHLTGDRAAWRWDRETPKLVALER